MIGVNYTHYCCWIGSNFFLRPSYRFCTSARYSNPRIFLYTFMLAPTMSVNVNTIVK